MIARHCDASLLQGFLVLLNQLWKKTPMTLAQDNHPGNIARLALWLFYQIIYILMYYRKYSYR